MRERTKTNWLFPFQWLSGLPLLLFNHVLPSSFRSTLKMLRLPSESVLYREPPMPPPVEYSLGCIVFVINNHLAFCTKYSSFFEVSACTTLSPTVVGDILNVWILVSVASNRNRSHALTYCRIHGITKLLRTFRFILITTEQGQNPKELKEKNSRNEFYLRERTKTNWSYPSQR